MRLVEGYLIPFYNDYRSIQIKATILKRVHLIYHATYSCLNYPIQITLILTRQVPICFCIYFQIDRFGRLQ